MYQKLSVYHTDILMPLKKVHMLSYIEIICWIYEAKGIKRLSTKQGGLAEGEALEL